MTTNVTPIEALAKALVSQFHPKMLMAVLMPFGVTVLSLVLLLIVAWDPLDNWFITSAHKWSWFSSFTSLWGMSTLSGWLSGLIAFFALSAISLVIGLAVASVAVTPLAVSLLGKTQYQDLEKRGKFIDSRSIFNAVKVGVIFVLGWLLTLPLWLIPFASIVLSVFWTAYAFSQIAKVDAITEHASPAEREFILKKYNRGFWIIGLVCGLVCLIPFMGLVVPVYAILACTHYGLSALRELRHGVIDIDAQFTADNQGRILSNKN
ncbi:CysZ-like protein [Oligella urethralis]|uniref:EI24 domain-containing protein n=1 Tax=Oligella urethralis TaxID=90245 RepID=UPI000DFC1337|nr:EI24 domain-containing protein [Oligella urethralis]SUA65939.1 CysZ-like protein [Oligella urethralis]